MTNWYPPKAPSLNHFLKYPCYKIFVSALTYFYYFLLGFITLTAKAISSFPPHLLCLLFFSGSGGGLEGTSGLSLAT